MKRCVSTTCLLVCLAAVLGAGRQASADFVSVYQIVADGKLARGEAPEVDPKLKRFQTQLERQGFAKYKFTSVVAFDVPRDQSRAYRMMYDHTLHVRPGRPSRANATKLSLRLVRGKRGREKELLQTEVELAAKDVLILGAWPVPDGHLIFVVAPGAARP
jgi:hypothetical protein